MLYTTIALKTWHWTTFNIFACDYPTTIYEPQRASKYQTQETWT